METALSAPLLIVFDLDFTLWDCGGTWCDCLSPPFRLQDGHVVDRRRRRVRLYDDVEPILSHCDAHQIPIAVASRTEQPDWARQLLDLLAISHRFAFAEIYPSSKLQHFAALRDASGVDYSDMLFFDDEMRNIREVSHLGVTCIHVPDGLDEGLLHSGLTHHVGG
jgi:magnesium-dependent phosphatase 1